MRRLMTFAWPCLLSKNCVEPATKYHGHLLLSHTIAKFAIHKCIVLQVTEDDPLMSNLVFQSYNKIEFLFIKLKVYVKKTEFFLSMSGSYLIFIVYIHGHGTLLILHYTDILFMFKMKHY